MQAAAVSSRPAAQQLPPVGCDDEPACCPNSSSTHSDSSDSSSSSGTNSSSSSSDNSTSSGSSTSSSDSDTWSSGGSRSRSRSSSRTHRNSGRSRSRDRPKARHRSRNRNDSKTGNKVRSRSGNRAWSRGYGRSRSRDRHGRQRHSSPHHAAHGVRMRSRSIGRGPSRRGNTPRSSSPGHRSLFVGHRVSLELLRRRHQDAGQHWRHATYDGSSRGRRCRSRSPGFRQRDRSSSPGCRQRDRSTSRGGVRNRHGHTSSSTDRGRGQQHRARNSSRSRMSPSRDRQPDHSRDKQGTAGAAGIQASLGNEGQRAKQQVPGSKARAARAPSRMPVSIAMQECQREVSSSPDARPQNELQHSMDMPGTSGAGSKHSRLGRQQGQHEARGQLPQLQAQQQEQQQQQAQQQSSTVLQPPVPEGQPYRHDRSSSRERHGNKQAGDMPPLGTSPQPQHVEHQAAAAGGASSTPRLAQPQDDGSAKQHSSSQQQQPDSSRDKQGTGRAAQAQPSSAEGNRGQRAKQQVPGTIARPARPRSRLPVSIAMQECQREASNSPDARPRDEQQHSMDARGAVGAGGRGSRLGRQQGQQQDSRQLAQLQAQQQEQQQQQDRQQSSTVLQPPVAKGQPHRRSCSRSRERHGDKQMPDMPLPDTRPQPQHVEHPAAAAGGPSSRPSHAQPQDVDAKQHSSCQQEQQKAFQPAVVDQAAAGSRGSSPAHCRGSDHSNETPSCHTGPGSQQGPSADATAAAAPDSVEGSKPAAAGSKPNQCRRNSSGGGASGAHSSSRAGRQPGSHPADGLAGTAVVSTVSCLQACTGPDSEPPTLHLQDSRSGSSTQEAVEPPNSSSAPLPAVDGGLQGVAAAAAVPAASTSADTELAIQQQQTPPDSSNTQEAEQLCSSNVPLSTDSTLQGAAAAAGVLAVGTSAGSQLPVQQQQSQPNIRSIQDAAKPHISSSGPLPAAESSLRGAAAAAGVPAAGTSPDSELPVQQQQQTPPNSSSAAEAAGVPASDTDTPASQQQQQPPCAFVNAAPQHINALLCDAEPYRPQALRTRHLAHRQRPITPAQQDSTVGQQQQQRMELQPLGQQQVCCPPQEEEEEDSTVGQQQQQQLQPGMINQPVGQQQVYPPPPEEEAIVLEVQQCSPSLTLGEDAAAEQLQLPAGEGPLAEPAGQVDDRQQVESVMADAAADVSKLAGPAAAPAAAEAAGCGQPELTTAEQDEDWQQQQQQEEQQQQAHVQEMAPCSSTGHQQHYHEQQQQQQAAAAGPPPAGISGVSRSLPGRAPAGLVIRINRLPNRQPHATPSGLVAACASTPADVVVADSWEQDMDLSPTSAPVPAAGAFAAGAGVVAAAGAMQEDIHVGMSPTGSATHPWSRAQQQQQHPQLEQHQEWSSSGPGDGAVAAAAGFSAVSIQIPAEKLEQLVREGNAGCEAAHSELEQAVRQVEVTAQEFHNLEGQMYRQCDAAGNPLPHAVSLSALVAQYPKGVDAEGHPVLVVSSVLPDAVPISVLLAMKVKCDNVLAIKQKWAEQGKIMEQCLVKLREHMSGNLLAICMHELASIQQTNWLWLNPPSGRARPDPLSWEALKVLTSGSDPQAVCIMPVSGQTASGFRYSLADMQQRLAGADWTRAAVAGRLPPTSFYLQQLPQFDDSTACWLLWDHMYSGGPCGQAVSISQLRLELVEMRRLPLQQLVYHAADTQRRPAWALELCYLHRLDRTYADRNAQVQMQVQRQHSAAYASPQAAAVLPTAQQMLSPYVQQPQQPCNHAQGAVQQAPVRQKQHQQQQMEPTKLLQQQQQYPRVQSPLVLKQQRHQHSPLQVQQQQQRPAAAALVRMMQQQQQQQQRPHAAALVRMMQQANAAPQREGSPNAVAAVLKRQQQQQQQGSQGAPGAPSPPAPCTPPTGDPGTGTPAAAASSSAAAAAAAAAGASATKAAALAAAAGRRPRAPFGSALRNRRGVIQGLVSAELAGCSKLQRLDVSSNLVSKGGSETAAQQPQQGSSATAAAVAAVGADLCSAAAAAAGSARAAADAAAARAAATSSSSQPQQQQSEPPSSDEADVVVVQHDFTNVRVMAAVCQQVVVQDAAAAAAVQLQPAAQQQQQQPAAQQKPGSQSREVTPEGLLAAGGLDCDEMFMLEQLLPPGERSSSPEDQATKPAPASVPVPEPGAAASVSPPGTGDSQLISPGPLPAPALAAGLHKLLSGPQEQQQQQQQPQPVAGRLTVASAVAQHIKQKVGTARGERAEQQEAESASAAGSPGPAPKRRKVSASQQVLTPAAPALRSAADLLAPEDRAAVLEAAGLTQRAGKRTCTTSVSQPSKQQQRVKRGAKQQQQQVAKPAAKQQQSCHAVIGADGKVAVKQRQQDSAAAAAANRSEASSSTTNAEVGASTSSRQVEKPAPQQQQPPQSRLSRPQQQASPSVSGKRRRSADAPDNMPAVSAAAVGVDSFTKQELRNAAFGLRPTKQQLRQQLSGNGASVPEQTPPAQPPHPQQQQQQRRPPKLKAAGRLSSQLEQSSAAAEHSPPPEVQPLVHQQLQAVKARAGSVSRAVSPAAGPLAAAFPFPSPSPTPTAAGRGARSRARSLSAPPGSRAASLEPPPPVLQGCARGLGLSAAVEAAKARKKPGYSRGLYQALQRRERLQDYRTAAAASGVTTGPYGSRAQLVPYALPACLLRMDRDKAAASNAREGSVASAVSAGGSRAGRATSARNAQVLAEANKRRPAKPGKQLALQRSGVHGYGLFAAERIQAGDFVIEYVGVIIRPVLEDIVEARYEQQGQNSSYLFTIDKQQVADATVRGGLARFINHCCDPNCKPKEFYGPDGVARMGIYALRDIQPGEELHYDYQFEYEFEEDRRLKCYCGAAICPGYMNWQEGLRPEDLQGPARSRAQQALLAAGSSEQQQEQAQ